MSPVTSSQRKPRELNAVSHSKFRDDVLRGLAKSPKELPSQYLYDDRGSQLFDQICEQPEYYLTRTEFKIMRTHIADIASAIGPNVAMIEPGCGSGQKTRLLLHHLRQPYAYAPIEISRTHLLKFVQRLHSASPNLVVHPVCADFNELSELPEPLRAAPKRVVYFPGSTIGNMTPPEARALLARMASWCEPRDQILVGVDAPKNHDVLLAAYDDAAGVSAEFALNYLVRLNHELDATFDLGRFRYEAVYNETQSRIEMYVTSQVAQTVDVAGRPFCLSENERLRTEWSYKYDREQFRKLTASAGLREACCWQDPRGWFRLHLLAVSGGPERVP